MKILIALSRFPYPIDKGDKLRAYYQLRHLSKKNDLYIVCLIESLPSIEAINHLRQFCKELILVKHEPAKKVTNLFLSLFNAKPFQVNYFSSSEMKNKINMLINKENIDLCYVQLVRLVENIPFGLPTKYYLDYMDALSEGMNKRFRFSDWYEKPLVSAEAGRLGNYEQKVFNRFDGCSIISSSDADFFTDAQKKRLDIIPNGVSEDFFTTENPSKEYDIIFTGNMNYHPNIQACKFLVNNILPKLQNDNPDIKICLAGTNPHAEVRTLSGVHVVVTGYVKDIKDFLSMSRLFVAPLFSGSGLQNKLLEAMAAGLPVITTQLAGMALNAENDKHFILCEDADAFAENIIRLLRDKKEAERIGSQGKKFVKEHFNWETNNKKLEDCFFKLTEKLK
ncbi:MAG TPA: glycosyltransferase [Cytophagaceae bacterium]|jgi:sugar transferase (PEP-CTERM/EpsH1 system associated)|nr:glycosyltransferase [Cytophagaceae bacterium]